MCVIINHELKCISLCIYLVAVYENRLVAGLHMYLPKLKMRVSNMLRKALFYSHYLNTKPRIRNQVTHVLQFYLRNLQFPAKLNQLSTRMQNVESWHMVVKKPIC